MAFEYPAKRLLSSWLCEHFAWLFASLVPLGISGACDAQEKQPRSLIGQANDIQTLAQDPQWLALLHYDRSISQRSRAQPSPFFLSPRGDTDPEAELIATLEAARASQPQDDSHALCRYPARTQWLKSVGAISSTELSRVTCERFQKWREGIQPEGITLIFPTSFLNNPASAFGHTFVRLDQRGRAKDATLLDYAADFAASTYGENALVYAFKGIFGGYDGFYTVAPFYKRVEKYSDLENRDIWEYQLNFTEDEVSLLTAHLWELREHPFTYYYFDENCSYHILALLNVARPSIELPQRAGSWVIPVDTIRILTAQEGLIKKVTFRPSAATKLRARIDRASATVTKQAIEIAKSDAPIQQILEHVSSPEEKAAILDLGFEYLTYEQLRNRSESPEEKQRLWNTLAARSALPRYPEVVPAEPAIRPEQGHGTALFSVGGGLSEDRGVGEIVFRPAFHALTDPDGGYLPGNQIQFMETAARYTEGRGVELNRLTVLDIMALTPRETFFQPVSWRINTGFRQYQREGEDPLNLGSLSVGAGRTYRLGNASLIYGMVDAEFEFSSMLDHGNALGAGPRGGVIVTLNDWLTGDLYVTQHQFFTGDSHGELITGLTQRATLTTNTALRFDISYTDAFQNRTWNPMIRLERFFTP